MNGIWNIIAMQGSRILKQLMQPLKRCLSWLIIGSICVLGCSNSGQGGTETNGPMKAPTISNLSFCFNDGDIMQIYGTGFGGGAVIGTVDLRKVLICDSLTWDNRAFCEDQNYVFWSDTAISASVHMGKFIPGASGYIYLLDKVGEASLNGYPMEFCGAF